MLEEDVVLKEARYDNESLLMVYIPAMVLLPAFFGGDSIVAFIIMLSMSLLAMVNVVIYPSMWIDAPKHTRAYFFLCVAPYVLMLIFACFRMEFSMLEPIIEGPDGIYAINEDLKSNILAVASSNFSSVLASSTSILAIMISALSIYFVTQSRFIVQYVIAICAAGVGVLACVGLISDFFHLNGTFSFKSIFGIDSFSTFFDAYYWSYFAMLWGGALMAIGTYTFQRFTFKSIYFSVRTWVLAVAAVIFVSAYHTGSPLFKIFLFIQLALIFAVYTLNVLPTKKNLKKHENNALKRAKRKKKWIIFLPFLSYLTLACVFLVSALNAFLNYKSEKSSGSLALFENYSQTVHQDSLELVKERPMFGWGESSFANAFVFKQGDDLEFAPMTSPDSDLLKFLVEYGYLGFAAVAFMPLFFFVRFLLKREVSQGGMIFLATILPVTALACLAIPFQSPIVLFSFMIVFFCFIAWEDAEII